MSNGRDSMLQLLRSNGITSERVVAAMASVPREEFVLQSDREHAYDDRALGIDHEQTISQPLMVALLVQALELQAGDKVLDVGTGSGYQAAVIAACGATVFSVERIPELAQSAADRLERLGFEVDVTCGDGGEGLPDQSPFDAIAIAAAVPRLPVILVRQLKEGGRLVAPVRGDAEFETLTRVTLRDGIWHTDDLGPCRFVPLVGLGGFED